MKLRPMHNNDVETVARWLSQKENHQWLDFGAGKQLLEEPVIRMMYQGDEHDFQVFTPDPETDVPIGLVALSDISIKFNSATLWYILGNKKFWGRRYTTRAVNKMLTHAFDKINLKTVYAWAVEQNTPSIKILRNNNFKLIGRRRKCHHVNGEVCDRLLFDLLDSEHQNITKKDGKSSDEQKGRVITFEGNESQRT